MPPVKMWKPDLLLYNSANEAFDATFPTNVIVKSDGSVSQIPPGQTALPKEKKGGTFWIFSFYVRYSTLLHLPPLRFHVSEEDAGIDRQDCCDLALTARRSYHSARSHPHSATDLIPKEDYVRKFCTRSSFPQKNWVCLSVYAIVKSRGIL